MSLDLSILAAPLAAGLLVLASHVPLGRQVLARGIIFIDLAVAQMAGLGVIVARTWAEAPSGLTVQLAAVAAAGLGALLLHGCERRWPEIQEALIGVAFVLAATGGLLLLAGHPHGAERLKDLLSGQILWTGWGQLVPMAVLTAGLLTAWFWPPQPAGRLRFYLLFALAVTASVQLVGVYLVFASLIIPALAVRRLNGYRALAAGWLVGTLGYVLGLVLSLWQDWPAGPAVVWALAVVALMIAGWSRGWRRAAGAREPPRSPP